MNRIKAILARFGIRTLNPTLRNAQLESLRAMERTLLPENACAELRRNFARMRLLREQIREIECERLRRLAAAPTAERGVPAKVRLLALVIGVGVERSDMPNCSVFYNE